MDKYKELVGEVEKEESVDYSDLPIYEAVLLEVILDDSGKEVLIETMEYNSLLWLDGRGAIAGWHYFPDGREDPKSRKVIFDNWEKDHPIKQFSGMVKRYTFDYGKTWIEGK